MESGLFLSAFISLFVIADPFGTAAVFAALTRNIAAEDQKKTALRAVLIAIGLLIGFTAAGAWLLDHMGISLAAFRTAGGFLLFVTGFRMIMGFHDPDQLNSGNSAYKDRTDIAVFPLAIPLLAGPGCITAMLMFYTSAKTLFERAEIWTAIVIVEVIAFFCLIGAARLVRVMGPTGIGVLARIMGILLAAMAVQFIVDGLGELGFGGR